MSFKQCQVLRERPPLDASMLVFTGVIIGDIYVCFSSLVHFHGCGHA